MVHIFLVKTWVNGSRAEAEEMPWIERRGIALKNLGSPTALKNPCSKNRKRKKHLPICQHRRFHESFSFSLSEDSITSAARISHRMLILRALCVQKMALRSLSQLVENLSQKGSRKNKIVETNP